MKYIEELLSNLQQLSPIDTGVQSQIKADKGIKAIVFDIYGTLLVSSSGDIDQAEISTQNLENALSASHIEVVKDNSEALQHILDDFEYTIKICHREAKRNNIPYPEIDILSIWEIVLLHARRKNLVRFNDDANILRMTCIFEFLSNQVFPMPGMKTVIEKLKERGYPLGIVSNAQFYTPVVMNYFLNNTVSFNEEIKNFDSELIVYSYKLGKGKPDTALFADLVPVLKKKYNLQPEEVLFVGNDMLKDIYPSNQQGFKTALFAGDKRSLRTREDDARVNGLKPNYVITKLEQLLEIVS